MSYVIDDTSSVVKLKAQERQVQNESIETPESIESAESVKATESIETAESVKATESVYNKNNEFILISAERLQALEKLESKLPNMIETAIIDYKKDKLKKLHEKDKLDPAAVNIRVKRYALKHKDEINAKRRLKREEKKAAAANKVITTTIVDVPQIKPSHTNRITLPPADTVIPDLTVRFDN